MTTSPDLLRSPPRQQLTAPAFAQPDAVVGWLGAVQAQDYAAAKWALGLRLPAATDAALDAAFAAGTILRTHVLRPTWHFVAPADIRWLLALTAPRVHAQAPPTTASWASMPPPLSPPSACWSPPCKGGSS